MTSILEVPEEKPAAAVECGPARRSRWRVSAWRCGPGTGHVSPRRASRRAPADRTAQPSRPRARTAATELDLALAAVRGHDETVAQRVGVPPRRSSTNDSGGARAPGGAAKGQADLDAFGGEVGKVNGDVEASKAAIDASKIGDRGDAGPAPSARSGPRRAERQAHRATRPGRRPKRAGLRRVLRVQPSPGKSPTAIGPVAMRPPGRRPQAAQVQPGARRGRRRDREEGQPAPGARGVTGRARGSSTRSSSTRSRRTGSPAT